MQGVKYAPFSAARAWLHRARVQGTPSFTLPPESSKKPRLETRCGYFLALQHTPVYIVRYKNVPHCTGTFVPLFRVSTLLPPPRCRSVCASAKAT